ncbi:MAG: hypothetical protein CFE26_02905 [Verrucomicrobiales bacterium VVV1]|nr:MAG: hypothetical protein CFE26_02905 [Verrucomicrobiales bacterium VVV1]
MEARSSHATLEPRTNVFRLSCWILALLGFVELLSAGLALAARMESTREVRVVEREVTKYVSLPSLPGPKETASIVARPPQALDLPTSSDPAVVQPRPITTPAIADPVIEKLVTEARKARVAEDMILAITKLEEAKSREPNEPNVEYELGLVHEAMGVFDTASEHYQNVMAMGATKAGTLYTRAAAKLRDGIEDTADMRGQLSLGRTRIFKDVNYQDGERVVLTIPVQAAPGTNIGADDFFVTVKFFDIIRGKEIVPTTEETSVREYKWVSGAIDWAGGEELLRVTYVIPHRNVQDEHLFGQRVYYGQSVELNYKNELIDLKAWPPALAARSQQPVQSPGPADADVPPEFLDKDSLPPGFNPDNPLLPLPLPSR